MSYTKEHVIKALSLVHDPHLKDNLVDLNMIKDLTIEGKKISFTIILTTPACPLKKYLKDECVKFIKKMVDKDAEIVIKLDSKVTTTRKDKEAILPGVKNIIAVSSGKGGVGKSTVSANLAVALAKAGAKTALVDADIYGPSMPIMFGLTDAKPKMVLIEEKEHAVPLEKYDVKILSIGFFVAPEKALAWRGPMAANALGQLIERSDWGEIDYMIIDLPPGTGDIQLSLLQKVKVSGVIVVSTPQEVALADARKAVNLFCQPQIKVPILGLIENMSYFTPPELPEKKYYLFGKDGGEKLAKELKIPLLGKIPIEESICESGDNGVPSCVSGNSLISKSFTEIAENLASNIAISNAYNNKQTN